MDIAAIASLLGSLKTATDIAKFVRETDFSLEKAETKLKLAELVAALADAKIEAAEIQQAIIDRDEKIRSLTSELKLKTDLKWRQPYYYMKERDETESYFCQLCRDSDGKLARLHTDGSGRFHCSVCNRTFKTEERSKSDKARDNSAIHGSRSGWMSR
jgi:hypothetical protein